VVLLNHPVLNPENGLNSEMRYKGGTVGLLVRVGATEAREARGKAGKKDGEIETERLMGTKRMMGMGWRSSHRVQDI
jgi:hypothetical protein